MDKEIVIYWIGIVFGVILGTSSILVLIKQIKDNWKNRKIENNE